MTSATLEWAAIWKENDSGPDNMIKNWYIDDEGNITPAWFYKSDTIPAGSEIQLVIKWETDSQDFMNIAHDLDQASNKFKDESYLIPGCRLGKTDSGGNIIDGTCLIGQSHGDEIRIAYNQYDPTKDWTYSDEDPNSDGKDELQFNPLSDGSNWEFEQCWARHRVSYYPNKWETNWYGSETSFQLYFLYETSTIQEEQIFDKEGSWKLEVNYLGRDW